MDEMLVEALARAAGLDLALERFRDDVMAAARLVAAQKAALAADLSPGDEPWPLPPREEEGW